MPPRGPQAAAPASDAAADAEQRFADLRSRYATLSQLELTGSVSATFDVDGEQRGFAQRFSSSYLAPNRFRYDAPDEMEIGSDGSSAYLHLVQAHRYVLRDRMGGEPGVADLASPIPELLQSHDPSLFFAMSAGPLDELGAASERIEVAPSAQILGHTHAGLRFHLSGNRGTITLAIDPGTGLIRRMHVDLREALSAGNHSDVREASLDVDYQSITVDSIDEPSRYAWNPPVAARDAGRGDQAIAAEEAGPAVGVGDGASDRALSIGDPAPDFVLPALTGSPVALHELRGDVVVIDFWASWYAPCRESLPILDEMAREFAGEGVRVLAVDVQEDEATARAFATQVGLEAAPVLIDRRGDVAIAYTTTTIPRTIIVGRDGKVSEVIAGYGPGDHEHLRRAIERAAARPR